MLRAVKTNLQALETEDNKYVGFIVGARPMPTESKEAFVIRKSREVALAKAAVGLDVKRRTCWKIVTWMEHIHRHPCQPCLDLLLCQNSNWLQSRRAEYGGRRTRSRANPGVPMRWETGWLQAMEDWSNEAKDKSVTARRADQLHALIF